MGFRIAQMADLARQMQFTPLDKRGVQLAAAEELLLQIDAAKAYPFNFILYRITGYHPKAAGRLPVAGEDFSGQLLTGMALQHDLGMLIEQVSEGMNLYVNDLNEPVFTIDQICQQFNVSDKWIQRWRRRGLAARRFIFPDGKRRVGFLAGSVERFFAIHRDGVASAANFSVISAQERQKIVRQATQLMDGGFWAEEIIRRIGKRMNRSALAISHILCSNLSWASKPPDSDERQRICADFARGISLSDLATQFVRPRSAIYRILLEHRLENTRRDVRFIDDPLYHQPDAAAAIADIASAQEMDRQGAQAELRVPRDLPPYLQDLYRKPLLTSARERALFLKMHFHWHQFLCLQQKLESARARWRDLDELETQMNQALAVKNELVAANLRLVVSVARKHVRPTLPLMDLISDGNIVLMRAVDSYDVHRGNRFCTYATLALMKEYARGVRRARLHGSQLGGDLAAVHGAPQGQELDQRDEIRQLLSQLAPREEAVVRAHFGLRDESGRRPETMEEVGKSLGLSMLRLRQIERIALEKLRAAHNQ